jgi:2-oxo-3-hexenedioate decarboxylase
MQASSAHIDLAHLAKMLDDASTSAKAVAQIVQPLTLADAYEIQKLNIDQRLQRGERLVGLKMGFTSKAKALQMSVADVICGRLTDAMSVPDGGMLNLANFVHPRVEPEVVFRLHKPLSGQVTPEQALDAVDAVAAGLEIIDSRFEAFKFSLTDVVADNASSSAFVIGRWCSPQLNLADLVMTMTFDGETQATGSTAAILDHPLNSLVAAARLAAAQQLTLEPGWIVFAGGATAAGALRPGVKVSLQVEALGSVGFSVEYLR